MPIRLKYLIIILIFAGYLGYHFYTLPYSPLIWQDETHYHSMSLNFLNHGTFHLPVSPERLGGRELLMSGPIYFVLSSTWISLWGDGIYGYRSLGLLIGIIVLALFAIRLKKLIRILSGSLIIILALFLDPFVNASLHKGRFDYLVLLFLVLSYFFLERYIHSKKLYVNLFLSGLLFSFAILTSSRAGVFLPVFLLIFVHDCIKYRIKLYENLKQIFIWGLGLAPPVITWIFYAFGSIGGFFDYYQYLVNEMPSHILGNIFIPLEEYVLIGGAIVAILIPLFRNFTSLLRNRNFIISTTHVICFYLLVGDVGPYSILIVPFLYLIIGISLSTSIKSNFEIVILKKLRVSQLIYSVIIVILLFNSAVFLLKSGVIFTTINKRNPYKLEKFVKDHIPANSKLVGDEVYYYAAINNNCDFQYAHLYISESINLNDIIQYRTNVFNFDYLIISDRLKSRKPNLLELYMAKSRLSEIGRYESVEPPDLVNKLSGLLPYDISIHGYDGTIYKRIR